MNETTSQMAPTSADPSGGPVLESLARVSRRVGLGPLALRLRRVRRWLSDELDALEVTLLDRGAPQNVAERAGRYLLEQPGKRVRPLCVVLAARVGDRPMDEPVRDAAVACELVHAATLLHDDVLDEGDERRGVPAARVLYGNSVSILAGDHLLLEALQRVAQSSPELVSPLLETIAEMVAAEALQLERRNRFEPDRGAYRNVVDGKTAALFRWGLQAGGQLAGLSHDQVHALGTVGIAMGRTFQLVDDVLDLEGDPATTGKSVFADIAQGKMTWPLIIACERDPGLAGQINGLSNTVAGVSSPASAAALVARVADLGGMAEGRSEARREADRAREALVHLPQNRARNALETVIDALVRRVK